jgi:pimeloyl-ACP methyl ester carboxylesterase
MKGLAHLLPVAVAAAMTSTTGCIIADLWKVRETKRAAAQYAYVGGTVTTQTPSDHWIVVFIWRVPCDADWHALREAVASGAAASPPESWSPELRELAHRIEPKLTLPEHQVLQRPGSWYVRLLPGCYGVGAWEDVNEDYKYDDDPAARSVTDPDRVFELTAGERKQGIEIVIPRDGRLWGGEFDPVTEQVCNLKTRSHGEQLAVSLDQVAVDGAIADLGDPRFGMENAKLGFYDIRAFLWKIGSGIYFLEPYDSSKIPVLFVHGVLGHPRVFEALADSLDRTRFQPWFFYYPSGADLDGISDFLSQRVARLQLRHGFDRLVVVAHSMGGLVSRSFILKHHEQAREDPVRLFVSISTPWSGVAAAKMGVELMPDPYAVRAWTDVAPKSEFLRALFFQDPEAQTTRRPLPDQVNHQLIFGVEDRTISLASAVRWEALRDAEDRWPLAYDHTKILKSPELFTLLREILAREIR